MSQDNTPPPEKKSPEPPEKARQDKPVYEPPRLTKFDKLETLIVSGE